MAPANQLASLLFPQGLNAEILVFFWACQSVRLRGVCYALVYRSEGRASHPARASWPLPGPAPAKKGQKGITLFVKSSTQLAGKKFTRKNEVGKSICVVEFLGRGNQTVLPPSIHPDGPVYQWVGRPLYEWPILA